MSKTHRLEAAVLLSKAPPQSCMKINAAAPDLLKPNALRLT
jgi:hypothetical protein